MLQQIQEELIINKREFLLYPNRYIKMLGQVERIVVTNRSGSDIVVTLANKGEQPETIKEALKEPIQKIAQQKNFKVFSEYGCGCKRTDKFICSKHQRH